MRDSGRSCAVLKGKENDEWAWYLRQLALYYRLRADTPVWSFSPDRELPALFKEHMTKRKKPEESAAVDFVHDVDVVKKDVVLDHGLTLQRPGFAELAAAAQKLGALLQLNSTGFLANVRQHRQCGMSMIQMAQAARRCFFSPKGDMNFRDFVDIGVDGGKSPADDPVWWIDLLTPEAFEEGFGLQTPLSRGSFVCLAAPYFHARWAR